MWACGCVFCGGMSDAMRAENRCKTFSTEFFDSKNSTFSTRSASRNPQSKKVESKKPFFDRVRKPERGFSRKRPFSTDKSDSIRNGLRLRGFRRNSYLQAVCDTPIASIYQSGCVLIIFFFFSE